MKVETSVLDIFQDPLLTIVALILMGTLWIVIPSGKTEQTDMPNLAQLQIEVEKLREDLRSLDQRIKELEKEVEELTKRIHSLKVTEKEAQERAEKATERMNQLMEEISRIQSLIQDKKEELGRLERELEEARKRHKEAKVVEGMDQRIRRLKEEIAGKEAILRELEEALKQAREEQRKEKAKENEQKKVEDDLQRRLEEEEEAIGKLKAKKTELERVISKRGGMGEYSTAAVGNKRPHYFEASENKLVLINERNYDIEPFRTMHNNQIVIVAKLTKKKSIIGEPFNKITEQNSEFQKKLKELDPDKDYIFLGVRKDSFEIFLEARQIVWERGFVVGWGAWEEGPIYAGPDGGENEGRR